VNVHVWYAQLGGRSAVSALLSCVRGRFSLIHPRGSCSYRMQGNTHTPTPKATTSLVTHWKKMQGFGNLSHSLDNMRYTRIKFYATNLPIQGETLNLALAICRSFHQELYHIHQYKVLLMQMIRYHLGFLFPPPPVWKCVLIYSVNQVYFLQSLSCMLAVWPYIKRIQWFLQ